MRPCALHLRRLNGIPAQVIAPGHEVVLSIEDLKSLPEAERRTEARGRAEEEARRPFDLARGPLLRVKLFRLAEEEHLLLLNMHHIISDEWSMEVLLRELAIAYDAYVPRLDARASRTPDPVRRLCNLATRGRSGTGARRSPGVLEGASRGSFAGSRSSHRPRAPGDFIARRGHRFLSLFQGAPQLRSIPD